MDDGNTIPFVARYRKEVTGGLDEVQLRQIESRLAYLRNLHACQDAVLKSIAEEDKLTPALDNILIGRDPPACRKTFTCLIAPSAARAGCRRASVG